MTTPAIAIEGFTGFERRALLACLRHAFCEATDLAGARYIVADAEQPAVVAAIVRAGRVADTVFVGAQVPDGALAWTMRPLNPAQVLRQLPGHRAPAPSPARWQRRASDAPPDVVEQTLPVYAVAPVLRRAAATG